MTDILAEDIFPPADIFLIRVIENMAIVEL